MFVSLGMEAARSHTTASDGKPPPPGGIITIGAPLRIANTRLGWTSVSKQGRPPLAGASAGTAILATASAINNQPIMNHGATVDIQPGAGAAYNWTFTDATFGLTPGAGYFPAGPEMCMTAFGCPPHMRIPKPGFPYDPHGPPTNTTSLSSLDAPHSSWFPEFADLCAAAMARYPHVKYLHPWTEMVKFYFGTQYPGSSLVPPGSGLPALPGSNRWWSEGYVALYNLIWQRVKAVRPDAFISGPYSVLNSFSWDTPAQWANKAFPDRFLGPWGFGDIKVLSNLRYFIQNCAGADAINVDIRNRTQDWQVDLYYDPSPLPAAPDGSNAWLGNPEGGTKARYFLEGDTLGAWNGGQKMVDFQQWVRDLGNSSTIYQRPVCDARTVPVIYSEFYAHAPHSPQPFVDPHTGDLYANQQLATHQESAAAWAWNYLPSLKAGIYYLLGWKPEGSAVQPGDRISDPSGAHPIALWVDHTTTNAYQPTELKPVCDGLVANFPPGTQLIDINSNVPEVTGIASPTKLMLVSRSPSPISLTIQDTTITPITLGGYGVQFFDRASTGSGFAMPLTDPTGMTRVFQDDFTAYPNVPLGSFLTGTSGHWGGYGDGTPDTGRKSQGKKGSQYNSTKTVSIINGVLDVWLHTEPLATAPGGFEVYSAAPWPIIPGNQPTGVINGHDYGTPTNVEVRANIYYGQIEFAFRASRSVGWKTAWLLWPDYPGNGRQNGEIDFPEGDLNGVDTIKAFMHHQDSATGSDQASRNSLVTYADNVWHKGKIVWKPDFCEFWLDDVKLGITETYRVPANPMHWVLQCETEIGTTAIQPANGADGHVQLDWLVMHQLDGY